MYFDDMSSIDDEIQIQNYTNKQYSKFLSYYDIKKEVKIREHLYKINPKEINIYNLYSLKILDLVDKECMLGPFFDQNNGFVKMKHPRYKDGNEYASKNEIFAVTNEIYTKPRNEKIIMEVCARVRVLALKDIWKEDIDCDDLVYSIDETPNYLIECKKYFLGNKKYMKYARLLRSALQYAKYFEGIDFIPKDFKEYKKFLKNPFIYCILEPYNILDRQEASIFKAFFIDGDIIFSEDL